MRLQSMGEEMGRAPGTPRRWVVGFTATALLALATQHLGPAAAAGSYDWPQFGGNPQHSGNNTQETTINAANAASLTQLLQANLGSTVDGAPAYLSGVATAGGSHDMLFMTTKGGTILAVDAHSGATLWSHSTASACHINTNSTTSGTPCYTTSSPAIDPNRQYVYSYGLDGDGSNASALYGRVHKYAVGDGMEVTSGGWPETATLKGFDEKGSSALAIAAARNGTSYLYVANGGYPGDNGDYQGHVTTINLATGTQNVFNANCSNLTIHFVENGIRSGAGQNDCSAVQTAIWARAAVVYNPATDRIYMSTGNGTFNPGAHDWGDTVFSLNPDGTGANGNPLGTYTPTDYQTLQNQDADIGSTAPALLPAPAGSKYAHLALQSGKDSQVRLLNLDALDSSTGQTGGEIQVLPVPQGNEVLSTPAVWVNPADGSTWAYIVNDSGASALKLTVDGSGNPSLSTVWKSMNGGFSPLIANGVLYYAGSNNLWALDPTTGGTLWHSTAIGGIHWQSPVVANGVLYITDNSGHLTAFASAATPTATNTAAPATATNTAVPATSTNTPVPPTATNTAAPSATNTPVPPTATNTSVPPTATNTSVPSTSTKTPLPPTASNTPVPLTATNTSVPSTATPTGTPVAAGTEVAIDSGGPAAAPFVADTDVSGGNTATFGAAVDTSAVTNPAPQAVYRTERYGDFTYTIPNLTPGGRYLARLHFSEGYWGAVTAGGVGSRVFNVSINGTPVLDHFDVFAVAGGANKAIVRQFPATASGTGTITLQYTTIADNAKSSGIEIIPVAGQTSGLAGYWKFDEGTGTTAADSSGLGNNGSFNGGVSWTSGQFGAAAHFDGTGYIAAGVVGLPAANAPQTISWWLNVPSIPSGVANVLSLSNDAAQSAVQPGFRNGTFGVWSYGGTFLVSTAPASTGAWHHYAYTFDGTTHSLYVDDVLKNSSTRAAQTASPTKLEFGRWTGGSEYLNGSVDDVRIYTRALSAAEVATLATQP